MADVYLLNQSGQPLDIIDNYIDITWTRHLYTFGEFFMRLKFLKPQIDKLEKLRFIAPQEEAGGYNPDHVYLIEQIQYSVDEGGASEEIVEISGRSYGGIFEERLILPTGSDGYDTVTNTPTESAMKAYVNRNAAAGAASERQLPEFYIEPDQGRGTHITYQGRYQKLSDALESLGRYASIGWEVFYDTTARVFRFDVILPQPHQVGSAEPVYFDLDYETITAQQWVTSDIGRKNFAYVGGKGEGSSRPVEQVYTDFSVPSGLSRREIWVDAQEMDNTTSIQNKGYSELYHLDNPDTFTVELTKADAPFRYRRDFDLGDIVTVRNTKWNLQVNVMILGVTNRIQPGTGKRETSVQLSKEMPSIRGKVYQAAQQASAGRRK